MLCSLLSIDCVKHLVTCVALHVVGGLVKIANSGMDLDFLCLHIIYQSAPWYVILPCLAHHPPGVVNDHGCVPDRVPMILVPLQDRRHNHHPVPSSKL